MKGQGSMAKKKQEDTLLDIIDRIEEELATLRDKVEELEEEKDEDEDEDEDFEDDDDIDEDDE
jgi:hypothetical protein